MHRFPILFFFLALAAPLVADDHASPSVRDIADAYVAAFIDSDLESMRALTSPDVTMRQGVQEVSAAELFFGLQSMFAAGMDAEGEVLSVTDTSAQATFRIETRLYRALDLGAQEQQVSLLVKDGKVTAIEVEPNQDFDRAFRDAVRSLMMWASSERPETLVEFEQASVTGGQQQIEVLLRLAEDRKASGN